MVGRSVDQYLMLLKSLLPRGKAWSKDTSSILSQFLTAVADEFVRLEGAALSLLDERDTRLTSDLLTDHEYDLGLPDECSSLSDSIAERRNQAHAKLTALGGQHKQYFIDLANALGIIIGGVAEPSADPAILPTYLLSKAASADVNMAIRPG